MTDEQFGERWEALKAEVRKARGKAVSPTNRIRTMMMRNFSAAMAHGGSVFIGSGDEDGANIYMEHNNGKEVCITADADDLRRIAAHCIVAAEEIEKDQR